jgi:hypothetical protein
MIEVIVKCQIKTPISTFPLLHFETSWKLPPMLVRLENMFSIVTVQHSVATVCTGLYYTLPFACSFGCLSLLSLL